MAVTVLFAGSSSWAQVSFADKTVRVGIASDPGGGTDRTGRLMAQFLEKYLPGEPTVIVQNFGAGGGKIRANNYLALQAPADGSFVLQTDGSPLQPHVVRRDVARYDPRNFHPIGALNRGGSIVMVRKEAHARLKDPGAKAVIVGAISGTRSWQAMTMWGAEFLGWNLRWIPGYKGTSSMTKALRQGEIDVFATNNIFVIGELKKDGVIDLIAQAGQATERGYEARENFEDVPIFPVMLKNANPPKVAMQGYKAIMGPSEIDKWITLPPDVSANIVGTYRVAFGKIVKDPEFLKVARKQLSQTISPIPGETVAEMIREVHDAPAEAIGFGAKLRKKYGLAAQ